MPGAFPFLLLSFGSKPQKMDKKNRVGLDVALQIKTVRVLPFDHANIKEVLKYYHYIQMWVIKISEHGSAALEEFGARSNA